MPAFHLLCIGSASHLSLVMAVTKRFSTLPGIVTRLLAGTHTLAAAALCTLLLCANRTPAAAIGGASATVAQLTLPSAPPNTGTVEQDGSYLTAPIVIDGTTLFHIATEANAPPTQIPIAVRQSDVQTTLAQLLATTGSGSASRTEYDPATLRVHVRDAGDVSSLEAVDAKHDDPLPIVTVTSVDARYNQLSVDDLASQWQTVLQSALIRALERRQPAVERRSVVLVAWVAAALTLLSLAVWPLVAFANRQTAKARSELEERARASESQKERVVIDPDDAHRARRRFLALALQNVEPERRARDFRILADVLVYALVAVWFGATAWAFGLFPQTTPLAQELVNGTLRVASTIVVTGLLNRALDIGIARIASASEQRQFGDSEERARLLLRIPTIARALAGFKTFILVFIALLAILGEIGVPIGSVVTIGGLAAIALSLAAQNFVRDFVNGSLVLFEDHYAVGDYITINAASGIVEHLSLRMVQIRDAAGEVVTIPHSAVTIVYNQSRNWSRVDYRVPVDPATDVPRAIELVRAAIDGLANEEDWRGAVTLPLEWIGIDQISRDWAIVRASVRTAPLRQFEFRRELNARVIAAFGEAKIALGAQLPVSS